jgi:hypothetical protein
MSSDNGDMIDGMIGPDGDRDPEQDQARGPRKEPSMFSVITNKMLWEARELQRISREKIPRAFPLSPPKGGSDPGYKHTPFESMGASNLTDIEDGLFAIDTVKEISTILEGVQIIINSLFPTSIDNGSWVLALTDQLKKAKEKVDASATTVQKYLDNLEESVDADPFSVIDSNVMQRVEHHLVRLGYEFVKNAVVPQELLSKSISLTRPDVIIRDRKAMAENNNSTPMQLESMLMDSGGNPDCKLSPSPFTFIKRREVPDNIRPSE